MKTARTTRRRAIGAFLVGAALVGGMPFASPAGAASPPAFDRVLVGPSNAEMYPSGLEYDAPLDRLVIADTAGDAVEIYTTTGTRLAQFGEHGTADGQFASPRDIAIDGQSNIYVADAENNRVQKFDANGAWQWTVGGLGTCNTCLNTPIGVTWDAANSVVLVASSGQNLVKAFDAGGAYRWKSPSTSSVLNVRNPRDATRGPDGRIWVSDYNGHTVKAFDVTPAGVWTTTPVFTLGDGVAAGKNLGQLNFPYNVVFSADGATIFVSDTGNGRIARWDLSGPAPVPLAQFGQRCSQHPQPCPDPPGAAGLFNHLRRVAIDGAGNLYAADFWGNGIEVFGPTGTPLRSIEGASAPVPGVSEAYGVAVAGNGEVYVMDRNNHRIERFDAAGALLGVAGARGTQPGTFSWPEAVAVAPDGSVWAADTRGDRIQRWPANLATAPAVPSYGASASATNNGAGYFTYIEDLDVAPNGDVWIADTRNHRLQRFVPATGTFTVVGGAGSGGGQFADPRGVAAGPDAVYVADTLNNRVQKLSLAGAYLGQFTGLTAPEGVALAPDGTVWVADTGANRILHLSADLVDLGDTFGGPGAGDGRFSLPHTLAATATELFVADTYNDRVQVFSLSSAPPVDTTKPTGTLTAPAPNATVASPTTITGTASDNVGVAKVEVAVKRASTGQWLRADGSWGTAFTYAGEAALAAPGAPSTTWSFPFTAPAEGTYGLQVRGSDAAGNTTTAPALLVPYTTFKIGGPPDTTRPTGTVTAPAAGATVGDPTTITGTASDNVGVASVQVAVRKGYGSYLQGNGTFASTIAWIPATVATPGAAATAWSFPFDAPSDGSYFLQARAKDTSASGNLTTFLTWRAFTVAAAEVVLDPQYRGQISDPGGVAPLYPAGGVTAPDGTRYLADSGGSRLVRMDAAGIVSALPDNDYNDPRDLDLDPDGTLWVADTSDSQVLHITTAGVLLATLGGPASFTTPYGIAVDAAGLYVANTYWAGVAGQTGVVQRIDKATGSVVWTQTTANGKVFSRPRDVAVGSDGAIYVADTDNHRIVVLDALTGAALRAFGSQGGGDLQFRSPRAVTSDGAGGIWVADAYNYRIVHLSNTGTFLGKSSGTQTTGYGTGPDQYRSPHCVFMDGAAVEVCDTFGFRIQRYTVAAGAPVWDGTLVSGAPADGGFNGPFAVAYGPSGELFVVDWFNHRIQKFDADGRFVLAFGSYGTGAQSGALIFPRGVTVAGNEVVVTDSENNRIARFTLDGQFVGSFKPLTGQTFNRPHQAAVAADGTYWVADTNNHRIVHLDAAGTVLHSWNNGGTIKSPQGIAVDADGNVYVANTNQNRVERYSPDGTLLATLAGSGAALGKVNRPGGLLVTGAGAAARLWIADTGTNNRVQVLRLDGTFVAAFGTAGTGAGQFTTPRAVAVRPSDGAIAVADLGNDRVSLWSPT